MRVAIIGRTVGLLRSARMLIDAGYTIPLVITSKESPEYSAGLEDFRAFASEIDATFIRTARIGTVVEAIRSVEPCDIAASVNNIGVIPQEVIDCFELGILNAHGGDLPRYRGNACQAWAILNAEPHVGLCIHRMLGGQLDSGDIVAEERLLINQNTKIGEIIAWMESRIPHLMVEAINALIADPTFIARRQSDDPSQALRCYPRLPEDGRIDWTMSAERIVRLINASGRPYCGAFTFLDKERITIWEAELLDDGEQFLAVPGQITRLSKERVEVATGGGKVLLTEFDGGEFRSIRQRLR